MNPSGRHLYSSYILILASMGLFTATSSSGEERGSKYILVQIEGGWPGKEEEMG